MNIFGRLLQILSFLALCLYMTACATVSSEPVETPAPIPVVQPTPLPVTIPGLKSEWSAEILKMLNGGLIDSFDKAKDDMVRFCPNYKILTRDQKSIAAAYFLSGVIKNESRYNPACEYKESDGSMSIGLLQLSYGNKYCPNSKLEGDLHDPIINIKCGLNLAVFLIAHDGVVAAGGYTKYGAPPAQGAAQYWSVLRVKDSKSEHHLSDIIAFTTNAPGCH